MGKSLAFSLLLFGALIFFAGQWIAFEIYANIKMVRVGENMAQFVHGLNSGKTLISIDKMDENVFILRTSTGRVVTTSNAIGPLNPEDFISAVYKKGRDEAYVYIKRVSFSEYLNILLERPLTLGISLSGIILFIFGLFLILKTEFKPQEDLIKKLKALRTTFATSEIIPKESLSEAKGILDDIIKRMEDKK